jgi:hypothetical protein
MHVYTCGGFMYRYKLPGFPMKGKIYRDQDLSSYFMASEKKLAASVAKRGPLFTSN